MSTIMTTPEEDKAAFDAYTQKHGRLPPLDHPTLGESSDYGRNGSNAGGAVLFALLITVGVIAFGYVISGIWKFGAASIQ